MSRLWDPRAQPGRTKSPYVREPLLWVEFRQQSGCGFEVLQRNGSLPTRKGYIKLSSEMAWWATAGSSLSVSGVNTLHGPTSLHFCVLDFSSRLSYFGLRHAPCLGESEGFAVRIFSCSGWLQLAIWSWWYVKGRSTSSDHLTTMLVIWP